MNQNSLTAGAQKGHLPTFLRSHLIPSDRNSGVWGKDIKVDYRRFRRRRLDEICAAFEREAGIKLFQEIE